MERSTVSLWLGAVLAALAGGLACGGPPAEHNPGGLRCAPPPPRPAGLIVAGSGTNLALVRRMARLYQEQHPGVRLVVPESIGTGGAVRALLDRAIDVGLASRDLRAEERASGLVATPLARTRLTLAAHPQVPFHHLGIGELREIYLGQRTAWPDGTPMVPLLREPEDSGWPVLRAWLPSVEQAMAAAARARRWKTCYTDREALEALLSLPGALGFVDEGTLRLEQQPLRLIEVRAAGAEAAPPARSAAGLKPLSFVTAGPPRGEAARFIAFARSPAVAALLAEGAYLPP